MKYKKRNSVQVLGAMVVSTKPMDFLAKANAYMGGRLSVLSPAYEPE